MIVVLYQNGCQEIANKASEDLVKAFNDHIGVAQMSAETDGPWPADVSWDDLLIVIFNGEGFPQAGNRFIADYLGKRPQSALLLPVSINPTSRRPPDAASAIKALPYETREQTSGGRLVRR